MIDKSSLNLLNALKVSVFSHYSDSSFEIATLTWFWFVTHWGLNFSDPADQHLC